MKQPTHDNLPLWRHLEELRWTVFKCLAILTLSTLFGFAFTGFVYRAVLFPVRNDLDDGLAGQHFAPSLNATSPAAEEPAADAADELANLLDQLAQPSLSPPASLALQARCLTLLHERLERLRHGGTREGDRRIRIVYTSPVEPFTVKLKIAFIGGVAFAVPFVGYCLWGFVAPGLRARERRLVGGSIGLATLLFVLGGLFGYGFLPLGIPTLMKFAAPGVEQIWPLNAYIGFCVRLIVAFGLVFEMPLILGLATHLELVDSKTLARGRPYAVILCLVLAAILTPPDVPSQIALATPMIALYEIGILIGKWQEKRRARQPRPAEKRG